MNKSSRRGRQILRLRRRGRQVLAVVPRTVPGAREVLYWFPEFHGRKPRGVS